MSNHFECSICLKKEIDDVDRIVRLCECNHEFHLNCFKKWFEQTNTCPLCRKKITYYFKVYFKKRRKKFYLLKIDEEKVVFYELKKDRKNTEKDFSDIYLNFENKKSKKKIFKIIKYTDFKKISVFNDEVICIREKDDTKTKFYGDANKQLIMTTMTKYGDKLGLVKRHNLSYL